MQAPVGTRTLTEKHAVRARGAISPHSLAIEPIRAAALAERATRIVARGSRRERWRGGGPASAQEQPQPDRGTEEAKIIREEKERPAEGGLAMGGPGAA